MVELIFFQSNRAKIIKKTSHKKVGEVGIFAFFVILKKSFVYGHLEWYNFAC